MPRREIAQRSSNRIFTIDLQGEELYYGTSSGNHSGNNGRGLAGHDRWCLGMPVHEPADQPLRTSPSLLPAHVLPARLLPTGLLSTGRDAGVLPAGGQ